MSKIDGKYLRFREETNALDFLEKAGYFITQTKSELKAWKWVIISLHGALYGFAICACKKSDPKNVTKEESGEKLISFWEAIKRCQNREKLQPMLNTRPLVLSKEQNESIEFLVNHFRNRFEHYIPCHWSIEIHGMPGIAINVLEVIRFLALESGTLVMLDEQQRDKVEAIISESINFLQKSELHQELLQLKAQ